MAGNGDKSGWRYLAVFMAAVQLVMVAGFFYFWWAYAGNIEAIRNADRACFPQNSEQMDSIRAAQMFGRLDVLTLLFALVAATLGIAALIGVRVFRREVLAESRETAAGLVPDEVRKVAALYFGAGKGTGADLFAPGDVPYDKVPSEEVPDETAGPTEDNQGSSDGRAGSGRFDRARAWLGRLRDRIMARR